MIARGRGGAPRLVLIGMLIAGLAVGLRMGIAHAGGKKPATPTITVGSSPVGRPVAPGFLGVSLEYSTVSAYEGPTPSTANPVLAQLIENLSPGQTPIIRIGGDSTDWSWWPETGLRPPAGARTALSVGWLADAEQLVATTGARLILGINLEANRPTVAAVETQQLLAGIGTAHLEALELGNEPQLYPIRPWYFAHGKPVYGRKPHYNLADYDAEFGRFEQALPQVPFAGPSIGRSWLGQLSQFIEWGHGPRIVTYHAYAVNGYGSAFRGRDCSTPVGQSTYPTLGGLLAPAASIGLSENIGPYIALAHERDFAFRVDELNAITCAGMPGISDTFASALWALDTLFGMARAGVDGVNVHTWRGSAGKLFGFNVINGVWTATVRPEYYGLLMFEQAAPAGSRLLGTSESDGGAVQAWAVNAPDGTVRVVLVNNSLGREQSVLLRPTPAGQLATVERLTAPSAGALSGVQLGCQSFGPETTTGVLQGTPCLTSLLPRSGSYRVQLPAASAALVTVFPQNSAHVARAGATIRTLGLGSRTRSRTRTGPPSS